MPSKLRNSSQKMAREAAPYHHFLDEFKALAGATRKKRHARKPLIFFGQLPCIIWMHPVAFITPTMPYICDKTCTYFILHNATEIWVSPLGGCPKTMSDKLVKCWYMWYVHVFLGLRFFQWNEHCPVFLHVHPCIYIYIQTFVNDDYVNYYIYHIIVV